MDDSRRDDSTVEPGSQPGLRSRLDRLRTPDGYAVVLVMILASTIVVATVPEGVGSRITALLVFGTTFLFTLYTSAASPRLFGLTLALIGAAIILVGVARASGVKQFGPGAGAASAGLLVVITATVIGRRLTRHVVVDLQTIAGALCVYLLVGVFFSDLYRFIEVFSHPFFAQNPNPAPTDFLYYSYATLTTVGYGDLSAKMQVGRMLSVSEALVGQLYLVSVVAVLVSSIGQRRARTGE
jgi:hypothetical protein